MESLFIIESIEGEEVEASETIMMLLKYLEHQMRLLEEVEGGGGKDGDPEGVLGEPRLFLFFLQASS
ncbi:hypothetical protein Tco_0310740, partial [Tanacetum coccineum]